MKNILRNCFLTFLISVFFAVSTNSQTESQVIVGLDASVEETVKINELIPIKKGTRLEKIAPKTANQGLKVDDRLPFPASQTRGYVRPTKMKRFKRYVNRTVGTGLIGVGASSVVQQFAEYPPEWERTAGGFARRFGSNLAENVISESVAYGLEETFKLDSRFYKSKKKDFGSRLKNALLSSFTARTPSGKRVFNPSRIAGTYTADIIATETWYPKRYSYKDGLRQGTRGIGFSVGFNLLREFVFPD